MQENCNRESEGLNGQRKTIWPESKCLMKRNYDKTECARPCCVYSPILTRYATKTQLNS